MAHRAIPMIAFPRVRCMFIYILVSLTRVCVVYVVKEVTSFRGPARALGQLMGVARNRTCARVLQSSRKKAGCSFTSLCRNWN